MAREFVTKLVDANPTVTRVISALEETISNGNRTGSGPVLADNVVTAVRIPVAANAVITTLRVSVRRWLKPTQSFTR